MLISVEHIKQCDQSLLQQQPPRAIPGALQRALLLEYLARHPQRTYLDPLLLNGLVAALAMLLLGVPWTLWLALGSIALIRLGILAWYAGINIHESIILLQRGIALHARLVRLRLSYNEKGDIEGASLDCAVPISKNRVSMGSIWMPDAEEARRLKTQGYIQVLCLEHAPGTWMVLEGPIPGLRYCPDNQFTPPPL
jgi:hypothetical protein